MTKLLSVFCGPKGCFIGAVGVSVFLPDFLQTRKNGGFLRKNAVLFELWGGSNCLWPIRVGMSATPCGAWVSGLFSGNWGTSIKIEPNVDAMKIIVGTSWDSSRLWTTVRINVWPVLISVPSGLALGVWAALKKNKMTDHVISTLVMVFISVPSFIVINLLLYVFSYRLGVLPSQWPSTSAPTQTRVLGYIIPTMALSFGSICGYCRFTRAELTEVMSSDFLLLARTKGLTKSQSITRHALKNAMVPILPSILSEIIGLLGGSMILESLYGIPGVGRLYIDAINNRDYNVLMADMALYTVIGLLSGVFLDLSYGFIDPRIRMGAKK